MTWIIIIIIALIVLIAVGNQMQTKKRKEWLDDYKSQVINNFNLSENDSREIFKGNYWLNMDALKFLAIFGQPDHKEVVKMKTKTKEILHYNVVNPNTKRTTSNKFTFENSLLVKSDVKASQEAVWEKSKLVNPFSELDVSNLKLQIQKIHPSLYKN